MIVGYPNETAADFQDLIQFIRRIKWDRLGAFTYSHEEDTPAYQAADDVSESLKQRRLDELMLVQQEVMTVQNHRLIDTVLEVLIEGYDALKQHYRGRTVFSAPDGVDGIAFIDSDHELEIGNFYYFRITKADAYDLYGVVTE
ncbi:Ribosomal protein S12 methylthiotransferase RimO [bioreactor metagenome]|uniref:Ribosomal protein S12 methylthiotransferase RimO n=1 Tax=bioreactor metagenome TaxID=1076179 RepID=A0A645D485_9ZZZZ